MMANKCVKCGLYWFGEPDKCPHCGSNQWHDMVPDEIKDVFRDIFNTKEWS